jgi:hypothetical protein
MMDMITDDHEFDDNDQLVPSNIIANQPQLQLFPNQNANSPVQQQNHASTTTTITINTSVANTQFHILLLPSERLFLSNHGGRSLGNAWVISINNANEFIPAIWEKGILIKCITNYLFIALSI